MQDDIDDFRIGPDRVVRDLDDVLDELFTLNLRQTVLDMAFDKRHDILQMPLFEAVDEFFVVRSAFYILRKVLAVFDEIYSPSFADHEKYVVPGLTCCRADHAQQASSKLSLLFVCPSVPHVTRNEGHLNLLRITMVIECPDVSPGTVVLDLPSP